MSNTPTYRHRYENQRLDVAYRRFVDGGGDVSLGDLVASSKISKRQLQRYSSRDQWVAEMEERKTKAALAASLLTQMAAMAPETAAGGGADGTLPGVKEIMLGVLRRQQAFWDEVETEVRAAFADLKKQATDRKKAAVAIGQLVPFLNAARIASECTRKAYGIPDVTKLEFEDKTPAAKRHADTIRAKKEKRHAAAATSGAAPVGPHGPM